MFARIRHLASHTERYDIMAKFYGTIFGMKQITTGLMDENSKANAERGHISDGVIGMALLAKRAGSGQGLDHFGLTVDNLDAAVTELKGKGVAFTMEPKTIRPGVRIAFLTAPQNVSIELIQRG